VNEEQDRAEQRTVFTFILGDVHFWLPLVVLIVGLLVLAWVN
jgi:hypothetical protein